VRLQFSKADGKERLDSDDFWNAVNAFLVSDAFQ
jgi:hypothetical protein